MHTCGENWRWRIPVGSDQIYVPVGRIGDGGFLWEVIRYTYLWVNWRWRIPVGSDQKYVPVGEQAVEDSCGK
jgi:hypothetical protein